MNTFVVLQEELAAHELRSLYGLGVLQMPLGRRAQRYSMHILIRQIAADIRQQQHASQEDHIIGAFVGVNLSKGEELSSLQQTAYGEAALRRAAAAELVQLETPNFLAMLQLLAAGRKPRRCKILEEDSKQARDPSPFAVHCATFLFRCWAHLHRRVTISADPRLSKCLTPC